MVKPGDLSLDQILYNVVLTLFGNGNTEAAQLLLECELDEIRERQYVHMDYDEAGWSADYVAAVLSASSGVQAKIGRSDVWEWFNIGGETYAEKHPILFQIQSAFELVMRDGPILIESYIQLTVDSEGDWREHLRQVAQGKKITNQGRQFSSDNGKPNIIVWERLNFRSRAELKIAEELDKRAVMFLPNCAARIGTSEYRHNKEPDFLICHEGKWGILQVDSATYHQRGATDHEYDRQFLQHGVRVIQRFTDTECRQYPAEVVDKFLAILERNG